MHLHKWTPWEYTGKDVDYYLDGYFRCTKHQHSSYCTVCNKPRSRTFRSKAPKVS